MQISLPILLVSFLAMAGCSAIAVTYDYDKKANFVKYHTYIFSEDLNRLALSKFDKERVLEAIDKEMMLRGYASCYTTRPDTMDLIVDVQIKPHTVSSDNVVASNSRTLYKSDEYAFGPDFTNSKVDFDKYIRDGLFINIIDCHQQKIIWQGRSTKAIDKSLPADAREANINYAVGMIFRNYPVQSSR